MRTQAVLTFLALLLLGLPAAAQQQQAPPPWFTTEEIQQLQQIVPQTREAFNYKEYDKALGLLTQTRDIYQKARQRVANGEVELPADMEKQAVLDGLDQALQGTWYNLACALSRLGRKPEALDAFAKSIELGYTDADHARMDEDLDAIRGESRFQELLGTLEYNEKYALHVPEGIAGKAPLLVVLHASRADEKNAVEIFSGLADELGMVLVAPRAPITFDKDKFDWARTTDADEQGLKKLAWTIGKAKAEAPVDPSKVYLVGIGDGGKFATMYALMHPTEVAGVVSFEGYWNKYYYADFFPKAKEVGLKIALLHAKRTEDEVEPAFDRSRAGVEQLAAAEIPGKFIAITWGDTVPEKEDSKATLEEKRMKRRAKIVAAVKEALAWMRG